MEVCSVRRSLTPDERDRIRVLAEDQITGTTLIQTVLTGVYDALLSDLGLTLADFGPENRIDPMEFSVSVEDGRWLVGLLMDLEQVLPGGSDPLRRANMMLDWVNLGPGTREAL